MKVNLLSSDDVVSIKLPITELNRKLLKITLNPDAILTPAEETVFKEFTSAFESKSLNKNFFVFGMRTGNKNNRQCLGAAVKGPALDVIQEIVNFRNPKRALNLKLILTLNDSNEPGGRSSTDVLQFEPVSKKMVSTTTNSHFAYRGLKNLDDVLGSMETRVDSYILRVQFEVDLGDYVPDVEKLLQPCDEVTRRIFETRKFTDFNIESSEGSLLPCHKAFLIVRSKVLAATIEGDFKEAKEGRLLMSGLSTTSALAFLEFVYCNTVDAAITNCKVAFELLKAADYYDIPVLWSAMTKIMLLKRTSWFGTELALQTFDFVLKKPEKEGYQELKLKLIQILAVLSKDLDACPLFHELFPTSASREFFISTLSVVKP